MEQTSRGVLWRVLHVGLLADGRKRSSNCDPMQWQEPALSITPENGDTGHTATVIGQ